MSRYCYPTPTRTSTYYSTTIIRSTSFRTSVITLSPTGTQLVGQATTTRVPVITSYSSYITRRSTFYSSSCTTYNTRVPSYPYYYGSNGQVPTGVIVVAALAGLWALVFLGVVIFMLCFSKTAKRGRTKGQGGFSQNQLQNPQQQYTPVPQESMYSRAETQYPPLSNTPYGGIQQNLDTAPQNSYAGYQNYNANFGAQGTNQWPTHNPGAPSVTSVSPGPGPGPGYIPPGAANPMFGNPGAGGTISYSINSTTPSPPPGAGPGSDPHRMLYTQQNERLSAAVSLVHPDQTQQPQPSLGSYPATGPSYGQPQQTSSQPQFASQYRGYAEPSTFSNYNSSRI